MNVNDDEAHSQRNLSLHWDEFYHVVCQLRIIQKPAGNRSGRFPENSQNHWYFQPFLSFCIIRAGNTSYFVYFPDNPSLSDHMVFLSVFFCLNRKEAHGYKIIVL